MYSLELYRWLTPPMGLVQLVIHLVRFGYKTLLFRLGKYMVMLGFTTSNAVWVALHKPMCVLAWHQKVFCKSRRDMKGCDQTWIPDEASLRTAWCEGWFLSETALLFTYMHIVDCIPVLTKYLSRPIFGAKMVDLLPESPKCDLE